MELPGTGGVPGHRPKTEGKSSSLKAGRGWEVGVGWGHTLPGASSGKIKVGCELSDPILSVHFLQFHSAVLKPDLHLSVREVDTAADL